jgi:protein-tyrosine phosphatase
MARNKEKTMQKPRAILFVCTGNICRSPTAEALLDHQLQAHGLRDQFHLDSAGVDSHHIGHPPDARSQLVTLKNGVDMSHLRARNVAPEDFERFDLMLAMDQSHYDRLLAIKPKKSRAGVELYLSYAGIAHTRDVPDPYYGQMRDFDAVYELIARATQSLIGKLHT